MRKVGGGSHPLGPIAGTSSAGTSVERAASTTAQLTPPADAQLFPKAGDRPSLPPPGPKQSWLAVQAARTTSPKPRPKGKSRDALPARDPDGVRPAEGGQASGAPLRLIERHLEVLLKKSEFSDDRRAEWASTPDEVRRDPTYVRRLLEADYHYVSWAASKGDEDVLRAVLADADFVAAMQKSLVSAVRLMPAATLAHPVVRARLLDAVENYAPTFEGLPESLHRDEAFVDVALSKSFRLIKHVPLAGAAPSLLTLLEEKAKVHLAERGQLAEIPAEIRARPGFVEGEVSARPLTYLGLTAEERARVEPLFEKAPLRDQALAAFLTVFEKKWYSDRTPELWSTVPRALLRDDRYLRGTILAHPATIEWANLTAAELDGLFAAPAALAAAQPWAVAQLAPRLGEATVARPHVRDKIAEAVADDASYLKKLPPSLRSDPKVIEAALGRDVGATATHALLDALPAGLRARVEDALVEKLANERADWSRIPEQLAGSEAFARKLLARAPGMVPPPELAAALADLLTAPEQVAKMVDPWVARLSRAGWSAQEELWRETPPLVRSHPAYVRGLLHERPGAVAWEMPPAERAAIDALLRDPKYLAADDTWLFSLAKYVSPEVLGHPEVRASAARRLEKDAREFGNLPELLRTDDGCIRAALADSDSLVAKVPLPEVGAPVRRTVEDAWIRWVGDRASWSALPEALAADPRVAAEIFARRPSLYLELSEETRALGAAALDDDRFYQNLREEVVGLAATLSPDRLSDPRLVDAAARAVKRQPWQVTKLPESLADQRPVFEAVLASDPKAVKYIAYERLDEARRAEVLAVVDRLLDKGGAWSWREVPAGVQKDADAMARLFRRHPDIARVLSEEERALVAPVLADVGYLTAEPGRAHALHTYLTPEVRQDPRVKESILASIEKEPGLFHGLSDDLKREPRAAAARIKAQGWVSDEIPKEALGRELLTMLVDTSPRLLGGVDAALIPEDLFARAERGILQSIDERTEVQKIPRALRTLAVKREILHRFGMGPFASYGNWELLHEPAVWTGAPKKLIEEYLARHPEHLAVVRPDATRDPELAAFALEHARGADIAAVLGAIDPALFGVASFVDRAMALDPTYFQKASPALRRDPERARRAIVGHPSNLDFALIDRPALHEILRALPLSFSPYDDGAWSEERVISKASDEKAKLDLRTPALAAAVLAVAPKRVAELPTAWVADVEFLRSVLAAGPKGVSAWPLETLPAEVRANVEAFLSAETKRDPSLFPHLPASLRADPALLGAIIDRAPELILSATGAAASDRTLWARAIDGDARLFARTSRGELQDHAVRAATAQLRARRMAPREVPKALYQASDEVVKAAIEGWGGHGIAWFSSWLTRPAVAEVARRMILEQPQAAAAGLTGVPKELGEVLRRLPHDRSWEQPNSAALRFAITLADRTPALASQLPPELREHPSVRSLVWNIDPPQGAILAVRDPTERLTIVQKKPRALEELPLAERTRALVLAAVALEGDLLRHAPPALRDDHEVVLAAVSSSGGALGYASERLRADPEIVARAVRSDPKAFSQSLVEGPAARGIELLAVREGGLIDDRIGRLTDKDFVLAFAEHLADNRYTGKVDLWAQSYRFEHHFDDPEFVERLVSLRPAFLAKMPEKYQTPEALLAAAKKSAWYLTDGKGRLDPRTLPPETWPELARAFPREFVRTLRVATRPPEHLPKIKEAVIAAVHEDHRAMESVPDVWWQDDQLVAAAVSVNPFVLERFAPSRLRWLEELHPEVVAAAERRLSLIEESGFQLKRFEGRFSFLERLLEDRFQLGRQDPRPVAVVVYPKHDHNGAFDRPKFEGLTDKYRVMYYEAGSVDEVARALRDGTRFKPAEVVMLAAHGSPESLDWGDSDQRPDQPYQLRPEHTTTLAELVPAERLEQNAKVVFDACAVGGGGKFRRNLVNCLGEVWPHAWLQAAWFASSSGNRLLFHADGSFDRMDFRASETLRTVPYHVGMPTRVEPSRDPRRRIES